MSGYVVETVRTVYGDDGERYRIGPDPDGFGCVEVSYLEEGRESVRIVMPPAIARLVAKAMAAAADEVQPS